MELKGTGRGKHRLSGFVEIFWVHCFVVAVVDISFVEICHGCRQIVHCVRCRGVGVNFTKSTATSLLMEMRSVNSKFAILDPFLITCFIYILILFLIAWVL